jgi:hypothetical protein
VGRTLWGRDTLLLLLMAVAAGGELGGLALATYGLIGSLAGVPEVRQLLALAQRKSKPASGA